MLKLLCLCPSRGGCQMEQPWDSCCAAECLFYPGGSFSPRYSKAMMPLACALQPLWTCLLSGKAEIPMFSFFRKTGKNEIIKAYRVCCSSAGYRRPKITLQAWQHLCGRASFLVHLALFLGKISQLVATPIISPTPRTASLRF